MARTVDLTQRLTNAGKPTIRIGDITVKVDNSAKTMLKALAAIGDDLDGISPTVMVDIYKLLFSKADRAKIDALDLNFEDWSTLVETALDLVSGEDAAGEGATPATA